MSLDPAHLPKPCPGRQDSALGRSHSSTKLLAIYLNDHLAGATGGVELARRLAHTRRSTALGDQLTVLAQEITEDRAALVRIMHDLGVISRHRFSALGWAAEKIGRLKLNGHVVHRSPLSTLIELEALRLGVEGKRQLWLALRHAYGNDLRLDSDRLAELQHRADQQAATLQQMHEAAAAPSLTPTDP